MVAFATNYPVATLQEAGLDSETMHGRFPSLVYVCTTHFGLEDTLQRHGELSAWYLTVRARSHTVLLIPDRRPMCVYYCEWCGV